MSNNLGRTEVAVNQTNKEDAINDSDAVLDGALSNALTITWAGAEALKTLSTAQMQQNIHFIMGGSTSEANPVLKLADVQRGIVLVTNNLANILDVTDYATNDIVEVGIGLTVAMYATATGVVEIFVPVASGGSLETLADFDDGSFTGHAGKLFRVNDTEDGFTVISPLDLELLNFKETCRVATTGVITIATALNSGDSIDGVTLADGDRVLVKDNGDASNGIYIVSGSPARATDFDADAEVKGGTIIPVSEGTVNGNSAFMLTTNDPITVGATTLVFATFGGGGSTTFIGLSDTPANYTSATKKKVRVNAAANALEFVPDTRNIMATFGGVPGVSEVVFAARVAIAIDFPASMTGSYVTADVAATAQTDFDIQKNGASVGTIRFAAAGTTATYVGVSAFSLAAGDKLAIIAPNPADATLADIYFSLLATGND